MLLDVLSGLDELKICTAYEIDGKQHDHLPQPRRRPPPRQAGVRIAARLEGRNHRCRTMRRVAGQRPRLSPPHQRIGRPADRDGLRRPRARSDDCRLASRESIHAGRQPSSPTLGDSARAPAAAHRDHHGRQRPLGRAAESAARRRATSRASIRSAARPRNVPASRSSSSRSIACRAKTGSGRRPRSTS